MGEEMSNELAISVRRARAEDAPALARLVNRAYAVEQFFVDGDRTNADEIVRMMGSGEFVILEHESGLAGAVYVQVTAQRGYFGMLSVDPDWQGEGLGVRLVRIAEAICEAMGATYVDLKIINLREELSRWYRSLGYREVGIAPYTHRSVKQPCHFVEMRKSLRGLAMEAVA